MKYSPRPKLNENGVSDPRKFILIDVNGEKVLFEANTAAQRDAWVNAITFQFELAKGIAPTTVSPRVNHSLDSFASTTAASSSSGSLRGSGNGSSAPSTLRSKPSVTLSGSGNAGAASRVVTVVDSDDEDEHNNCGGNGTAASADDDALLLFPSVPSKVPSKLTDDLFPSVPDSDSDAGSLSSSTIDSSLFPSVPGAATAAAATKAPEPSSINSSGTIDLNGLFPSVPSVGAEQPAPVKPAPVARRPTLGAEVSLSQPPTLKPDVFPLTARSPRDDFGGFVCRVCGADTESNEALRQHTRQTHNRDLTYDCLFPGCRNTYTDEANLMSHLAHVHPTFARDNGFIDAEPAPTKVVMAASAPAVMSSTPPPAYNASLAAVEMTLGDAPAVDAKESLYAAFLLGPDTGSDREASPVVPTRVGGKTSADAMAAVAAEKARRLAAAASVASAPVRANAASAPAAPAPTRAAAAPAPQRTPAPQRAPVSAGVVIGGGDDDIPDAPDVPDTPSFDTPTGTTLLSAAAAVTLKPVVVTTSPSADEPSSSSSPSSSPRGSNSPFSAMALMNARKHMKATPSMKGVSLEAPQAARTAAAARSTSPRLAPRAEGEKTPAMLESLLHLLLKTDETLTDATRAAAVANWMSLFDGKWPTLQRLVDDYAGLVRVHALQPNTAYKKMAAWEKGLFRKLGDAEAAELRKQKMFFMESLELPEIEEHVAKHWALVEAKKKAAAEAERKAAQGAGMMGVLGQLKQRGDEQRARELAEAAAKLPTMEKSIEFDDDL